MYSWWDGEDIENKPFYAFRRTRTVKGEKLSRWQITAYIGVLRDWIVEEYDEEVEVISDEDLVKRDDVKVYYMKEETCH